MSQIRKVDVGPDGTLAGVSVVGVHGEVDPAHTPARHQPVLADEEGRIVRIERVETNLQPVAAWLKVGKASAPDRLPGVGTRLKPSTPAVLGNIVVVMGGDERSEAERLPEFIEPSRKWHIGDAVAWYCRPAEAVGLFQRIRRRAQDKVVQALKKGDREHLYRYCWWLSRTAVDDADIFLAAAGLEQCDAGMADVLLGATIGRKKTPDQVQEGLMSARDRLKELARWYRDDATRSGDGFLHRIWEGVRAPSVISRHKDAA